MSTYANSDDYLNWQEEAVLISEVKAQIERERLMEALENQGHDAAEQQDAVGRLAEMSPAQRLSEDRATQSAVVSRKQGATRVERSAEQTAQLLDANSKLSGGRKIAHARENGLL